MGRTARGVEKVYLPKESRASSTSGQSSASQAVGVAGQVLPPRLQVLLLGTAGTGNTHTAKIGITEVRLLLGSYESVLTMAFSGVASANLGTGSRTIDSISHTNRAEAAEDLIGPELDTLVDELGCVEFIVIDEISTCGAGTFEVVSRRVQQVARLLWRRRFRSRRRMILDLPVVLASCSWGILPSSRRSSAPA